MLRIALFLLTNLAIVLVASITLSLLGFEGYLAANGVDLNLSSLLVFCFVFGMAGSFVVFFSLKQWRRWALEHRLLRSHILQMKSGLSTPSPNSPKRRVLGCQKLESSKVRRVTHLPQVGIEIMRLWLSVPVYSADSVMTRPGSDGA